MVRLLPSLCLILLPAGISADVNLHSNVGEDGYKDTNVGVVTIFEGCTSIGKAAFSGNSQVSRVDIYPGSHLTFIEDSFKDANKETSCFWVRLMCTDWSSPNRRSYAKQSNAFGGDAEVCGWDPRPCPRRRPRRRHPRRRRPGRHQAFYCCAYRCCRH